jgi:hypothetical protein
VCWSVGVLALISRDLSPQAAGDLGSKACASNLIR